MTEKFIPLCFPHNLKRHPASSSFGLNLANVFSLWMSQIMNPESLLSALPCITEKPERTKLPFRLDVTVSFAGGHWGLLSQEERTSQLDLPRDADKLG